MIHYKYTFEHTFDVCFNVHTGKSDPSSVEKTTLVQALRDRINDIQKEEGTEAFGHVDTIYHVDTFGHLTEARRYIEEYIEREDSDLTALETALFLIKKLEENLKEKNEWIRI